MKAFVFGLLVLAQLSFADTTHEVRPIADTYVTSEAENRNFGAESVLDLKTYYAGTRLLLKFDKNELSSLLENKDLVSARLELPINLHWVKIPGEVGLFKMKVDWTENGATWKCPHDANTSNYTQDCTSPWLMWSHDPNNTIPYPYELSPFTTGTIVGEQAVPLGFDVAGYVTDLVNGNIPNNFGFAVFKISTNINDPLSFYSRESDVGPRIILTVKDKIPVSNKITAKLVTSMTAGQVPLAVNFDASQSKAKSGSSIQKFELDLGNGFITLNQSNPVHNHTFLNEGEFQAILKITDSSGEFAYDVVNISVMGNENNNLDNNYGYWINFPGNLNVKHSDGAKANITGDICKIWKTQDKNGSCQWVDKQRLNIQAFFPDMTSNVSSLLNVTTNNNRRSFTFQTPELNKNNLNTLTIVVGEIDPQSIQFGALKSKMEMRILVLDQKILDFEAQNIDEAVLKVLRQVRTDLVNLCDKIDKRNAKVPSILAQYNLPLQVDNRVSSARYYSTMVGGFRFELSSDIGNLLEGEYAKIKSRVTNINYTPDQTYDLEGYNLKYFYNNTLKSTQFKPNFGKGIVHEYTFVDTARALSNTFYTFNVEIEEKFKWWARKLGSTEFSIPVLRDDAVPYWVNPQTDTLYVDKLPLLSEKVVDDFGRLDRSTFRAVISGDANADITDKFTFESSTKSTEYVIKANLSELYPNEGYYEIKYTISDFSQNRAIPENYTRKYYIDRTPPLLAFLSEGNIFTTSPTYVLKASVTDRSETTTKIFHNGVLIATTADKDIEISVNLERGTNTFRLESADALGAVAIPVELKDIVLDFTPPTIAVNKQDNQILGLPSFLLGVTIEDQSGVTTKIFQNGVEVFTTSLKVFTYNATLVSGLNTFEIRSIDEGGNEAIPFKLNSITLDNIAPIISLNQQSGILTNIPQFQVTGTIADDLGVEYSIWLNGALANQSNQKNISQLVTLAEGQNTIVVKALDQAGNEATPITLTVKLDTIAPILSITQPVEGMVLKGFDLLARASSNEALANSSINGEATILAPGEMLFERVLTASQDGEFTITYRGTDLAGNSSEVSRRVTIDNTPPEVEILSQHGFDTHETNYLFKLALNELHDVQTKILFNGVLISEGTYKTFEQAVTLKDGKNTFLIQVTDKAGNFTEYQSRDIIVDSSAPTIASNSSQNILTNIKNFHVNAVFEDISNVKYELYHNGVLISFGYEKSLNRFVDLHEGLNSFIIKAEDLTGNKADDFLLQNITLDTIKPIISSSNLDNVVTKDKIYKIQASVVDTHIGETIILQNNVEVFRGNGEAVTFNATLTEGKNSFIVKSTDLANNESIEFSLRSITLNSSKPIIASPNKDNSIVTEASYTLNATVTDDLETTTVIKHNGAVIQETSDKTVSLNINLISGKNSFEIISTDSAGNISNPFVLSDINLDNVGPTISSTTQSGTITKEKNFSLNVKVEDVSKVETKIYHNNNLVYTGDQKVFNFPILLSEGQNAFEIRASDLAGNVAEPLIISGVLFDTVKPVIVSNSARDLRTKDPLLFLNATAYDLSPLTFKLIHNDQEAYSIEGSFLEHTLILSEGINKLEFIAIDAAGNFSDPFIISNIVLDSKPPVINLASANGGVQTETSFAVSGTIADQSNFSFKIFQNNALIFEGNQSPFSYTANLANGENSFYVIAVDELGNVSEKSHVNNIYLDNVPPQIIIGNFKGLTRNKNFEFTANIDDVSEVTTQIIHNGDIVKNTNTKSVSEIVNLSEGINTFQVTSVDSHGNQSSLEQEIRITLDSTPPAIEFNPPQGHRFDLANALDENLVVKFSDVHAINYGRLRIRVNGDLVEDDKYFINSNDNSVSLLVRELNVLDTKENIVSVEIADEVDNISVASNRYMVTNSKDPKKGPLINFNPGGGIVEIPLASIEIGFGSNRGIDYSTLSISIDGMPVSNNSITINSLISKAVVDLSDIEQSSNRPGLLIDVSIKDIDGNTGTGRVGVNFIPNSSHAEIVTELSYGGNSYGHMCIPLENGEAKCWGDNLYGQLGIWPYQKTAGLSGGLLEVANVNLGTNEKITKILVDASAQTCAITMSKKLFCWGRNSDGSLGYGNTQTVGISISPKDKGPLDLGEGVIDIVMGGGRICALLESKNVKCWGPAGRAILGYGQNFTWVRTTSLRNIPYLSLDGEVKQIVGNIYHTCALLENGGVKCWGINDRGQLGYGNTSSIGDDEVPADVGNILLGEPALQIALGERHTCALLKSGKVRCWGSASFNQLGYLDYNSIGDNEHILSVAPVELAHTPIQITTGSNHTCALFSNKKIKCWGDSNGGKLGYGRSYANTSINNIPFVDVGGDVLSVRAIENRTCAILTDKNMKCWGTNNSSVLGLDHVYELGANRSITTQGPVDIGSPVSDISTGPNTTCVMIEGKIKCWGWNRELMLGSNTPMLVGSSGKIYEIPFLNSSFEISQVSHNSDNEMCGVTLTGQLKCWGRSRTIENAIDINFSSEKEILQVEVGLAHNCALQQGGKVKCWGGNNYGQLGVGNTNALSNPNNAESISFKEDIKAIGVGLEHSCAISIAGRVYCWGRNNLGQLGYGHTRTIGDDETLGNIDAVSLGELALQISVGESHSCALLESGSLRCWGKNSGGQLGYYNSNTIGDNEHPSSVSSISFGIPIKQVSAGSDYTCAVLENGELKCWGDGAQGRLGNGNENLVFINNPQNFSSVPVPEKVSKVETSKLHTCALLEGGQVRCWGLNTTSALGYKFIRDFSENQIPSQYPAINLGIPVYFEGNAGGELQSVLAQFEPSKYYGQGPLEVTFNAMTSVSTQGEIVSYQWDFGNGTPIQFTSSPLITYTFTEQGVYNVKLTATDSLGNSAEFSRYITVLGENILPIAILTADTTEGEAPLAIQFDGSASHDPAGSITNYQFIFGDGKIVNGIENSLGHIFQNPGHYSAKLVVTDNDGGKGVSEAILIKIPANPSAPVISSATTGHIRTAESVFNIKANIYDAEEVTIKLLHNGNLIFSENSKNLDRDVILVNGNNYFEIQAVDELGNSAIPLLIGYIVLDSDVPKIASTVKSNTYTNKSLFKLDVQVTDSTRTTTKVFLNGILTATSTSESFFVDLNLVNDSNKVEIVASDEFGKTSPSFIIENLTLDQVAPTLNNLLPIANATLTTRRILVSGASNEILESASVNGILMILESDKKSYRGELNTQVDGEYPLNVVVKDRAGNETQKNYKVLVDTLPPLISHSNSSGYFGNESSYTITATVGDLSGTTTEIYHNGTLVYTTSESNISHNVTLNEGANTFVIRSYDSHGNQVTPSYIGDINLDTTPPVIVSNVASNTYTNKVNFPVSFNVVESRKATTKIFRNGQEVYSTSSKTISYNVSLDGGNNDIEIRSVDEAGNAAVPVLIKNIYLDQVAPVISLVNGQDGFVTAQPILPITGTINDELDVTTKIVLNGNLYKTIETKLINESIVLNEGINSINLIPTDAAGNVGPSAVLRSIVLDTQPPLISSSVSGAKKVFSPNFVLDFKIDDYSNTTTEIFVNGVGIYLSQNKNFNLPLVLNPGLNIVKAISTDSLGNKSSLIEITRITFDDKGPVINLASNEDIFTKNVSFNLRAEVVDDSETINYVYLNDSLINTSSEKLIDIQLVLVEGKNSVRIKSDEVGSNRSTIKLLDNVILDTVAPMISSSSPENYTTNEGIYRLTASVSDMYSTETKVSLNGRSVLTTGSKDLNVPLILSNGLNTIRIEVKDMAGNLAIIEKSNVIYQASSSIATTIGSGGGKHSVSDVNSLIYGSVVEIGEGAATDGTNLAVSHTLVSDLPNVSGVPLPDPLGPIVNFSTSKNVSANKTFSKEVVVGVPYSALLTTSKKINNANISIIRYDATRSIVENIRPFKLDHTKGIAYGMTDSLGYFFVSSGTSYPKVALEFPMSCRKIDFGHTCPSGESEFTLKGVFRHASLNTAEALEVTCTDCSAEIEVSKVVTGTPSENLIEVSINGDLSPSSDNLHLTYRIGNLIVKDKVIFKGSEANDVPRESVLNHCFETGAVCKLAGNGSVAYSQDNSVASASPLNLSLGRYSRPNHFKLVNSITKHDGVLFWIEPTYDFFVMNKVQDLVNYRLNEFAVRRRNLDGTISTVESFIAAINSTHIPQNEWEYNFNLQVIDEKIIFSLDSHHHLFSEAEDLVLTEEGMKLVSVDRMSHQQEYIDSTLSFNEIREVKASGNNLYLLATSIGNIQEDATYRNGIFKYSYENNSWNYLTKVVENSHIQQIKEVPAFGVDGSDLSAFDGRNITHLNILNGKLMFADSTHNCLRGFNSENRLITLAGMCGQVPNHRGLKFDYDNLLSSNLLIGSIDSFEVDNDGNLYFSQKINGNMEVSVVSHETSSVKGAVKESSKYRLPSSTEAIRMDHVNVLLDGRDDTRIRLDSGNNLYFYNNSCVYNLVNPYEYLFHQQPFEGLIPDNVLSNSNVANLIHNSQTRDGYFSFQGIGSASDENKQLSDTLDAVKFLDKANAHTQNSIEKAGTWLANQNYKDTKNKAKQLEALALLANQAEGATLTPELRKMLLDFLKGYRSHFNGWGATDLHIINNEDSASAIRALSFVFNKMPLGASESPYYMSEFITSARRIIGRQFSATFGIFSGGFGPTNYQNMPTLDVTLEVVDGLLEYKKLDSSNNDIIAWNKKDDFNILKTNDIPVAVSNALIYIGRFKQSNGSYGDLKSTIKVLNTYSEILKSGIITNPMLTASLQNDLMSSLSFIKGQNINKESAIELAGLNSIQDLSELGQNIILTPGQVPNENPIRLPLDLNTELFGNGSDGILSGTGTINLNQFVSKGRKQPDAVNAPVDNIIRKYVYVKDIVEGSFVKGDEILLINLQGRGSGNYEFARINNIFYNESPVLIELDHDVSAAGFIFDSEEKVMIQRVPNYKGISRNNSVVITADAFNGEIGGVVAFRVQSEIPDNVSINVTGLGFRGGINNGSIGNDGEGHLGTPESPYYDITKNCGGGKAVENFFAAGGGAYATEGIFSGDTLYPAKSGKIVGSSDLTKVYLGCGGGSGISVIPDVPANGGRGGGIVLLFASKINFKTNSYKSEGATSVRGTNGEGITYEAASGSGGSIILNTKDLVLLGSKNVSVFGGILPLGPVGNIAQNGGEGRIRINAKFLNGDLITTEQKSFLKQKVSNEESFIGTLEE